MFFKARNGINCFIQNILNCVLCTKIIISHLFILFPQKSFKQSLMEPEFVLTDFAKMERPSQLLLAFVVSS